MEEDVFIHPSEEDLKNIMKYIFIKIKVRQISPIQGWRWRLIKNKLDKIQIQIQISDIFFILYLPESMVEQMSCIYCIVDQRPARWFSIQCCSLDIWIHR